MAYDCLGKRYLLFSTLSFSVGFREAPTLNLFLSNLLYYCFTRTAQSAHHNSYHVCLGLFSAGAGRTGTFIALSNILERVKAEGLLDVFQTVKSLRTQRPHMVQTVVRIDYMQVINLWENAYKNTTLAPVTHDQGLRKVLHVLVLAMLTQLGFFSFLSGTV